MRPSQGRSVVFETEKGEIANLLFTQLDLLVFSVRPRARVCALTDRNGSQHPDQLPALKAARE